MNRIILLLLVFSCAKFALAALPPRYQNIKDLNIMIEYIQEHPGISSTLESITTTLIAALHYATLLAANWRQLSRVGYSL